ncbi:oxidoreductase, partial [Streptomyces albidoflavus]
MITTQAADDNPGRVNHDALPAINPELVGRTVVVTGAGRGMGTLFLEELARRGVNGVGGGGGQDRFWSEGPGVQRARAPRGGPGAAGGGGGGAR